MDKNIVLIIQPCFYGIGFIDPILARGYDLVSVAASHDDPKLYGYEGKAKKLIVADIRDADSIIQAVSKHPDIIDKVAALIPGCDYVTPITSRVAEHFGWRHLPIEAASNARLKDMARAAFDKAGLPNAKYGLARDFQTALKLINEIKFPVVIKPTNCACSENVHLVENETDLKKVVDVFAKFDRTYLDFKPGSSFLVEEYITGDEFSVEIFLHKKEILFASVTEKIKLPPPYFVECGHVVPTSVHIDKTDNMISTARAAMLALGLYDGPSHVELRLSSRGPIIMEVNGRPGGDHISQDLLPNAFGINVFEATVDFYLGRPIKLERKKNNPTAIAYLVSPKDGIVKKIRGLTETLKDPSIVTSNITVKEGDAVHFPKSSTDRLGFVIAHGPTPKEAKDKAFELVNSIKIELE